MGLDIAMVVEVKQGGKWLCHSELDVYRVYALFGILADVRNGIGFGKLPVCDAFRPIAAVRGFPVDMSIESVENLYEDGVFSSWYSLAELLAYDWQQTTCYYSFMFESQYRAFCETKEVYTFSRYMLKSGVVVVEAAEMDAILSGIVPCEDISNYAVIYRSSPVTYADCCTQFCETILPMLKDLALSMNLAFSDVRVIFNFS